MTSRRLPSLLTTIAACIGIAAVALVVYTSALKGAFLFDDLNNIVENQSIAEGVFARGNWSSSRPLAQTSFALNYSWTQRNPISYHWTNNVIHGLAGIFLFLWTRDLFQRLASDTKNPDPNSPYPTLFAFWAALIWVAHPLNTQAVTYIVQRSESLMGLCYFAFLYLVAIAYRTPSTRASLLFQCLALIVYVLGLASKQVMVTAVLVGFLVTIFVYRIPIKTSLKQYRILWGGALVLLIVGTIAALPIIFGSSAGVGFGISNVTSIEYLQTQPEVILHYVKLVAVPNPLVLDYGWPPQTEPVKIAIATGVLFLGIGLCCWSLLRGGRIALLPIAALIVLLPTSSFIPLQDLAFEHRMYVPAALLIVAALGLILRATLNSESLSPMLTSGLCCLIVMIAGWMTYTRNLDYSSPVTMWKDVAAKTIDRGHPHFLPGRLYNNLGDALADEGLWKESIKALEQATQYESFTSRTYANLARGYMETDQLAKAKEATLKAIEQEPKNARIRQQLGLIEAKSGNAAESVKHFAAALELAPNDQLIQANLAQAYIGAGEFDKAQQLLEKLLESDADNPAAYDKLMQIAARRSDKELADRIANDLVKRFPNNSKVLFAVARMQMAIVANDPSYADKALETLVACCQQSEPPATANRIAATVYRQRGDMEQAKRHYEQELQVNGDDVESLNNLAGLIVEEQPTKSMQLYEQVLRIDPNYHQASYNLALLQLQSTQGDVQAAISRLEELAKKHKFPPAITLLNQMKTTSGE